MTPVRRKSVLVMPDYDRAHLKLDWHQIDKFDEDGAMRGALRNGAD
jgi:hypothetical protein